MRRLLSILLTIAVLATAAVTWPAEAAESVASVQTTQKKKSRTARKKSTKPRSSGDVRREQKRNSAEMQQTGRRITLNAKETERALNNLQQLEGEIGDCNRRIAVIDARLDTLNRRTGAVTDSIDRLNRHLSTITKSYAQALRRSQGRRSQTSQLAFLLSSESFAQAYRRLGAVRSFGKWRDKKEKEITVVRSRLEGNRKTLQGLQTQSAHAAKQLGHEKNGLQQRRQRTAQLVDSLKDQRTELHNILDRQKRQAAALEAELDRIITQEAEAARQEAERKAAAEKARKAEEERKALEARRAEEARQQAARKAAEEEAARLKAAEEAAAAKAAAAKTAEERKAAKAAEEKARKEKLAAEEKARRVQAALEERNRKQAELDRKAAEKEQKNAAKRKGVSHKGRNNGREIADGTEEATGTTAPKLSAPQATGESGTASASVNVKGSNFADMRGKLPMPVVGRYTIVKRFGRQPHPTLPHVETNNAGIDMQTAPGATVRTVFDGEISAVFRPDGYNNVVVIRHGDYLTVYANLGRIQVKAGDKVKAGQTIGQVYSDPDDSGRSVLHFEVRHGRGKENPELWLRR